MQKSICLASTMQVYKKEEIENAIKNLDWNSQTGAHLGKIYEKMLKTGEERFVCKPSSFSVLDTVVKSCPNFSEICEDLEKSIELSLFGNSTLSFTPVLLAGDPGVGKTYFAKKLSEVLDVPYRFVSMGTLSANWVLSGAAPTWSGARQGKVADAIIEEDFGNPLFLLDELDKTGGDSRYDPFGALLQLLERETAEHFRDEFLDLEVNASGVLWIATANDVSKIPDYILSRMAVYEIPKPTEEESRIILKNIYKHLLISNNWKFSEELSEEVLDFLGEVAPRDMKKFLISGLGAACLKHKDFLEVEDFKIKKKNVKQMGFLN